MANGDVYVSRLHYTLQGNRNIRTIYNRPLDNTSGDSDEKVLADHWASAAGLTSIAAFQSDKLLWDCIEVQKIFKDSGVPADRRVVTGDVLYKNINIPGIITLTEALPGQCSLLIQSRFVSDPMDAHYQGRNFWTGWVEGDQANGEWLVARWDVIGDAIITATAAITAAAYTFTLENWSATYAKLFNANPAVNAIPFKTVFELRGIKQVRTQRRRQPLNPCDQYFAAPIP